MCVTMTVTGIALTNVGHKEKHARFQVCVSQLSFENGLRQPCRLTSESMERRGEGTVAAISPLHHLMHAPKARFKALSNVF